MSQRNLPARAPRDLIGRILETPDLPRVVQGLEPAVLQQLVQNCGLEDAGPIVAFATTEQLMGSSITTSGRPREPARRTSSTRTASASGWRCS